MNWLENAMKNLLLLSHSHDFPTALTEWVHDGDVIDHEEPREECQLCENEGLRYHFRIENGITSEELWIGSKCILRFDGIAVVDATGRRRFSRSEKAAALNAEIKALEAEKAMEPLRRLWKADRANRTFIENCIKGFRRHGGFSPNALKFLFARMDRIGIAYSPSVYKVSLRQEKNRRQMADLDGQALRVIWPALSSAQRQMARTNG